MTSIFHPAKMNIDAGLQGPIGRLGQIGAIAPSVLHVRVVNGPGGGPDKNILRCMRYTNPARFHIAASYIHPRGNSGIRTLQDQAAAYGCPFHAVPESGPLDPRTVRNLLRLCRTLKVTVWHAHDYKSNLLGLFLRRFWRMQLVTTVHGWTRETWRTRLYYHLDRWCLARYDRVIAVSPQLRDTCRQLGVPDDRLTYLPNAVETDAFRPTGQRAALRREFKVGPTDLVIGIVGRLSFEKGVDRALQTLLTLRHTHPQVRMHLIGDGPEAGELRCLCATSGLGAAVRFCGWQPRTQDFYEMMDLLLLPSRSEGLPNVALEAMAMGVPVAATDVGGVRELLDDGRCGVLLDGNPDTWAQQIAPLLASPARRADLARRARQRIEDNYGFGTWVARINAIYADLLQLPPEESMPLGLPKAA